MIDERKLTAFLLQEYDRIRIESDKWTEEYLRRPDTDPCRVTVWDNFNQCVGASLEVSEIHRRINAGEFSPDRK